MSTLTVETPTGPATDFRTLFLIPSGLALVGALLLLVAFRPPLAPPAERHGDVAPGA